MAREYETHVLLSARNAAEKHEVLSREHSVDTCYPTFVSKAVDFELEKLEKEGWHAEHIFSHRNTVYARCWREDNGPTATD
jgi:hypothetical protein